MKKKLYIIFNNDKLTKCIKIDKPYAVFNKKIKINLNNIILFHILVNKGLI